MNFIEKTQNNRKTIALLVIVLGFVAAKSQPIITLDTGTLIIGMTCSMQTICFMGKYA